ncbi:unnamed protein product [Symbiodinium necroappetens]|uniref:Uncharacterized protein n=1 Tax=Symbiodinium necroappetens TaxID=1628268 RepID=A0A812K1G0_9DINO|nr:unnamed protein product [Symbiodinium necroappetens]
MVDRIPSSEPSAHAAQVAVEGGLLGVNKLTWQLETGTGDGFDKNSIQPNCPADAQGQAAGKQVEESEQLCGALDKFFNDFHRHIFDPVLLRLEALAIREDLSQVHKD